MTLSSVLRYRFLYTNFRRSDDNLESQDTVKPQLSFETTEIVKGIKTPIVRLSRKNLKSTGYLIKSRYN
ncbi:hypothetical protein BB560_002838 [Smittium megazygosporum]|uniref:Uncharacterized protein n=1 Tax=Smittium megazygosporum TaxID=133381 RepID=A0A2T9ZDS9_9FUNG|nr:hypothetical protein BB560_002838 [Smittium megazygosporum]